MKAYKLFRVLKDGNITPLFINKTFRLPIGEWLEAEEHPTKNYKFRPYWHCTSQPHAPHLSMKNRQWYVVEIEDYMEFNRPSSQGRLWQLAKRMKIIKPYIHDLTIEEVEKISGVKLTYPNQVVPGNIDEEKYDELQRFGCSDILDDCGHWIHRDCWGTKDGKCKTCDFYRIVESYHKENGIPQNLTFNIPTDIVKASEITNLLKKFEDG